MSGSAAILKVTKLVFFWKDFENARLDTSVDVPPAMITDFLSFVSTMRTYKPKTFHRIISTLSSFYRFLCVQGVVATNPLSGVERPRIKHQEIKYLKHSQVPPPYRFYPGSPGQADCADHLFNGGPGLRTL